jgi:hypothetical protein
MGKFEVVLSEKAQKNLLAIEKSGDKALSKKLTKLFWNFTNILKLELAIQKNSNMI